MIVNDDEMDRGTPGDWQEFKKRMHGYFVIVWTMVGIVTEILLTVTFGR